MFSKNYGEKNIMNPEAKSAGENEMLQSGDIKETSQNEKQNLDTKEHENLTKTLTPTKVNHPFSWWVKWISSLILIVAMIMTSNNIYPWNILLHFIGIGGWLIVAIAWNDRALIVINAVALAIFANGMVAYILKTYFP